MEGRVEIKRRIARWMHATESICLNPKPDAGIFISAVRKVYKGVMAEYVTNMWRRGVDRFFGKLVL
ncbi:MAG: hypothetical protein UX07_C0010G0014 [Parcubacteria group bacterium GW2011_GWA2_45_30]|nr:MAG: hypothetical protein UX07_C0010G0014 [Parcubacteria group bacterium GW2011_GWA2_45_30]